MRILVGYRFIEHSFSKLSGGPDAFVGILHQMGVPLPHSKRSLMRDSHCSHTKKIATKIADNITGVLPRVDSIAVSVAGSQRFSRDGLPLQKNRLDRVIRENIRQRILPHQQQIGALADFDGAEVLRTCDSIRKDSQGMGGSLQQGPPLAVNRPKN